MRFIVAALLLSAACTTEPNTDAVLLGRQQQPGYRIDPSTELTLAHMGFGVTHTGAGGFRLLWTGQQADVLSGVITTDGQFDPNGTSPLGGKELVANQPDRIEFRVNPTASENGLDLVTSAGPIYLDLSRNADRAATTIAFMLGGAEQLSGYDPVAIDVRAP
jgi:hypothetical protein